MQGVKSIMPREQISVDIPDEWNENMKHGRCWCGKPNSEFEKGQKFYCSKDHARKYSKRIVYWSSFKDKVLEARENKCVKCGHDKTSFRLEQEKLELQALNQVIIKHRMCSRPSSYILYNFIQNITFSYLPRHYSTHQIAKHFHSFFISYTAPNFPVNDWFS